MTNVMHITLTAIDIFYDPGYLFNIKQFTVLQIFLLFTDYSKYYRDFYLKM